MADVFISYAKADTSLAIGDDFRNEIMTELGRARAVVVIWTDTSIKSDWVRSEAGRAQADRKLIPVKLPHLTYHDLPPPFDVLHTENVREEDKIRAAVVAQLAKPAVEPSAWGLLTKGFKYEVLTWVGIVGGALTLFTNLGSVLKLADWARVLVEHWREWTHEFWLWAFGWLGIHVPLQWTPVLSLLLFGSLLTIGQAFQFKRYAKAKPSIDNYHEQRCFQLNFRRLCIYFLVGLPAGLILTGVVGITLIYPSGLPKEVAHSMMFLPPLVLILLWSRASLHAALSAGLVFMFFMIIAMVQFNRIDFTYIDITPIFVAVVLVWALPLILLSVAPAKAISRRLIFLALGLLLLIALNELSKLGVDLTAPKTL
jgi:TIR domain